MGKNRSCNNIDRAKLKGIAFKSYVIISVFIWLGGCTTVSVRDPLSMTEHKELAAIYFNNGSLDLAVKEYKVALKIDSSDLGIIFGLANTYLRQERYKEAKIMLKKAIAISKEGDFYNNLSWAYVGLNDFKNAEKSIKEAITLDPERAYIYLDTLGVINIKTGNYSEAEANLYQAIKKAPITDLDGRMKIYGHLMDLYISTGDIESVKEITNTLKLLKEER